MLIDEPPQQRRSRRPLDAARLALTLLAAVVIVVLSLTASRTVAGIEGDLNEASALVPGWLLLPLQFVAAFSTLSLWIGVVGLEIAHRLVLVGHREHVPAMVHAIPGDEVLVDRRQHVHDDVGARDLRRAWP